MEQPTYKESEQSVTLVLKNNIVMRHVRRAENCVDHIGASAWEHLDELEQTMLVFPSSHSKATRSDFENLTGKCGTTIYNRIKKLLERGFIVRVGNSRDPKQYYTFSNKYFQE